jgi:hypothetical protein
MRSLWPGCRLPASTVARKRVLLEVAHR